MSEAIFDDMTADLPNTILLKSRPLDMGACRRALSDILMYRSSAAALVNTAMAEIEALRAGKKPETNFSIEQARREFSRQYPMESETCLLVMMIFNELQILRAAVL